MNNLDNDPIMVSVVCTAYNHEKYIRQCLEGFVTQKTNFKYEVLVHDDASTDGTADIIREYERRYPEIIRPVYQKENQYSKKVRFVQKYLMPMARGKYVALCEGDDYWCDKNKLQKQLDALEEHPDCHACFHRVRKIYENGTPSKLFIPLKNISSQVMASHDFLQRSLGTGFQLSSYFFPMEDYREYCSSFPEFRRVAPVGDMAILLYFVSLGKAVYINQTMSCYRMQSVGSWTSRMGKAPNEVLITNKQKMASMYEKFDEFTQRSYHDIVERQIRYYQFEVNLLQHRFDQCLSSRYFTFLFSEGLRAGISILLRGIIQKLS